MVSELSKEKLEARSNLLMSEIENTKKYLENSREEAEILINYMKNKYGTTLELESWSNICDMKEVQGIKGSFKYWNRGYCRDNGNCKYDHSEGDCDIYTQHRVCKINHVI